MNLIKKLKRYQKLLILLFLVIVIPAILLVNSGKSSEPVKIEDKQSTLFYDKISSWGSVELVSLDNSGEPYIKFTKAFAPHGVEASFFKVESDKVVPVPCRERLKPELNYDCTVANSSVNLEGILVDDLNGDGNYEVVETLDGLLPDCEGPDCRYSGVIEIYTFSDGILVQENDRDNYDKLFQLLDKKYPEAKVRKSTSHWEN